MLDYRKFELQVINQKASIRYGPHGRTTLEYFWVCSRCNGYGENHDTVDHQPLCPVSIFKREEFASKECPNDN